MIIRTHATTMEKLQILSDAAKYDVACTSSGMERKGVRGEIGNSCAAGICHSFSADGRCISLLKVLYSNECIYDCKYCVNRASNDTPRVSFEPDELAALTIDFYHRNYIEGLFLSSGVMGTPNNTMEQMIYCIRLLREKYRFNGYIHCKAIPGADPCLIEEAGWLADRMSVNLELPTEESLRRLAPNKSHKAILRPLNQIHLGIDESRETFGLMGGNRSAYYYTSSRHISLKDYVSGRSRSAQTAGDLSDAGTLGGSGRPSLPASAASSPSATSAALPPSAASATLATSTTSATSGHSGPDSSGTEASGLLSPQITAPSSSHRRGILTMKDRFNGKRGFVAAGQSTQMIIGATPETDYNIIRVTEELYRTFDLKRVFFSAFINLGTDPSLPDTPDGPPLRREHRLYQADFLMRFYGFTAGELLSSERPNFNILLDPKGDWAVRNIEQFPVEVERADYFTLLRVPGIGPKSAKRIVAARRVSHLDFDSLKKMGVVLKRALYFITCNGKMMYPISMDSDWISRQLAGIENSDLPLIDDGITYRQMSLFDQDFLRDYTKQTSGK